MRRSVASLEAGVKYLILGALSTGLLVYGFTWLFGLTGETNLVKIGEVLPSLLAEGGRLHGSETGLLFGLMLVLVALGFKIAAAPFQLWVLRCLSRRAHTRHRLPQRRLESGGLHRPHPHPRTLPLAAPILREKLIAVLVVLAILTMIYGNLAAMPQDNFKRLLAYSSIAHAGYLLVAIASIGPTTSSFGASGTAVAFYLAGYLLMTLLTFLIIIVVTNHSRGDEILHFNGLARRSPFLAFGLLIAILSLAGVPFTVGFYGKWLVFTAAVQQQQFALVGVGIITVAAGFYYYLRVVAAMYWQEPNDDTPIRISCLTRATIVLLTALIIIAAHVCPGPS